MAASRSRIASTSPAGKNEEMSSMHSISAHITHLEAHGWTTTDAGLFPDALLEARLGIGRRLRSEEHTSELQSHSDLVCRLLLEKKKKNISVQEYLHRTQTW